MRALLLSLLVVGFAGPTWMPPLCLGAQLAIVHAQERSTPPGEWCQRPEVPMPKGGHACACHKADCADPDPNKSPAHTDQACLNFCTVSQCECPEMDCV